MNYGRCRWACGYAKSTGIQLNRHFLVIKLITEWLLELRPDGENGNRSNAHALTHRPTPDDNFLIGLRSAQFHSNRMREHTQMNWRTNIDLTPISESNWKRNAYKRVFGASVICWLSLLLVFLSLGVFQLCCRWAKWEFRYTCDIFEFFSMWAFRWCRCCYCCWLCVLVCVREFFPLVHSLWCCSFLYPYDLHIERIANFSRLSLFPSLAPSPTPLPPLSLSLFLFSSSYCGQIQAHTLALHFHGIAHL